MDIQEAQAQMCQAQYFGLQPTAFGSCHLRAFTWAGCSFWGTLLSPHLAKLSRSSPFKKIYVFIDIF